jgi:hypothetical protein
MYYCTDVSIILVSNNKAQTHTHIT